MNKLFKDYFQLAVLEIIPILIIVIFKELYTFKVVADASVSFFVGHPVWFNLNICILVNKDNNLN